MKEENLKVELGADLMQSVKAASKQAKENNSVVKFDFNGIHLVVDNTTNPDNLIRDYFNAHLMQWKVIGPDTVNEYDAETLNAIKEAKEANRKREEAQQKLWKAEREEKQKRFNKSVEGIEVEFVNKEYWDRGLENNQEGYGRAIYTYAENWAKLMQKEISSGKTLEECAEQTSFDADIKGITGFMYGVAVSILSHCWKYGEELHIWHNKKYNQEGEGVVNPAVLTIKGDNNE